MKATRLILICLLVAGVFSLFALTKVLPKRGGQNDKVQALSTHHITKSDVSVAQASKGHDGNAPKTLDGRPDRPLSDEAVAFANPASKIGMIPSKDLPVAEDKPNLNLPVGQKAEALSASEEKPDLPVSQRYQSVAPVGATDETKSDSMGSNPVGIGGSYFNNLEVYGQDGELLPSPEKVLARKAQSILENYKDRKAEGVIISEEVVGDDSTSSGHSLNDGVGPDSADMTGFTTKVTDTESTVETLAEQNTSDDAADAKSQTDRLLAALADGNPVDVRLQAIYLLADVAPDQVKKFLDDKEDIIRCEAERIVGILPVD
jgi:hypothetical protein